MATTATYNELKGIFFSDYHALATGPLQPLKDSNPDGFEVEFGRRLETLTNDDEGFLRKLIGHIRQSRKKLPCLVFDNADHFSDDFQRIAFLQTEWMASLGRVLLLLPMRDTTFWRARQQNALNAVRSTKFFLPRPPLQKVLERRFVFAIQELQRGEATTIRSLRGFRIRISNAADLLSALQKTFTADRNVSRTISMLASGDIREAMRLFEACVSSPYISLDTLLAAYLASGEYELNTFPFERSLFLGDWEFFDQERSRRICNLMCCPREVSISPLLGLRVLVRCYELRTSTTSRADKGFATVESILAFFATLGVPRVHTDKTIGALLYSGLLEPYELTLGPDFDGAGSSSVSSVKLTSAGLLHLKWIEKSKAYVQTMADDVQIFDSHELNSLRNIADRRQDALGKGRFPEAEKRANELIRDIFRYVMQRDAELVTLGSSDAPSIQTQRGVVGRFASWLSR